MTDTDVPVRRVEAVIRPLVENMKSPPTGEDWRMVLCEKCGAPCWERPSLEARLQSTAQVRYVFCCTLCAMQRGLSFHG